MNNVWTGQIGIYSVTTRLTLGIGGITAYIGNPGAGGRAQLGGSTMWLNPLPPASGNPAYMVNAGRLAGHELGHVFGINHPKEGVDSGIMNEGAGGKTLGSHIDQLLNVCGF